MYIIFSAGNNGMKKLVIPVLIVFFIGACDSGGSISYEDKTYTVTSDVDLTSTFETVKQGYPAYTETEKEGVYFFTNQTDFNTFYNDLDPFGTAPTIDFVLYRVVVYVDEYRPNKKCTVEITDIQLESGFDYEITVEFYSPSGYEPTGGSKPYHIIKVEVL